MDRGQSLLSLLVLVLDRKLKRGIRFLSSPSANMYIAIFDGFREKDQGRRQKGDILYLCILIALSLTFGFKSALLKTRNAAMWSRAHGYKQK